MPLPPVEREGNAGPWSSGQMRVEAVGRVLLPRIQAASSASISNPLPPQTQAGKDQMKWDHQLQPTANKEAIQNARTNKIKTSGRAPSKKTAIQREPKSLLLDLGKAAEKPQSLHSPYYLWIGPGFSLNHGCFTELHTLRATEHSPGRRCLGPRAISSPAMSFWGFCSCSSFPFWGTSWCLQALTPSLRMVV